MNTMACKAKLNATAVTLRRPNTAMSNQAAVSLGVAISASVMRR